MATLFLVWGMRGIGSMGRVEIRQSWRQSWVGKDYGLRRRMTLGGSCLNALGFHLVTLAGLAIHKQGTLEMIHFMLNNPGNKA
jgi:hypothetical protein